MVLKSSSLTSTADNKNEGEATGKLHERARPNPVPIFVAPMLAAPADGSFTQKGWIYEPKLDGMRALTIIKDGLVRMYSRRGLEITRQYPDLIRHLPAACRHNAILDGEIIALDKLGRPSFQELQQRMNLTKAADIAKLEKIVPVFYFLFDLVHVAGFDLHGVPLRERKRLLAELVATNQAVRRLEYFDDDGEAAYQACIRSGFEGIVAKRLESGYEVGRRSPSWIKVKAQQTEDFVVGGFTAGQGSRGTTFGALLLGYYDGNKKLIYCGSVGSGFDDRQLDEMMRRMKPLYQARCPFLHRPNEKKEVIWLSPEMVAEVKFMDRTRDGHLRAPVFLRMRDELVPTEVVRVEVMSAQEVIQAEGARPEIDRFALTRQIKESTKRKTKSNRETGKADGTSLVAESSVRYEPARMTAEQKTVLEQLEISRPNLDLMISGNRVSVTNLDRELWRSDKQCSAVTKRHYLKYLATVSHLMLPHMQGRPLTLIRLPYGVKGRSFYQRHWKAIPEFVDTIRTSDEELLFCNNLSSLIWFAQNRVLEFHTWTSSLQLTTAEYGGPIDDEALSRPDFLIVDIDVHQQTTDDNFERQAFNRAREAAFLLRDECQKISLHPFVKTSGRNGLHIFIPVHANLDFDTARLLAGTICSYTAQRQPDFLSVEMQPEKRGNKVLLDSSPNGRSRTVCTVYSARANFQAGVTAPVSWDELAHCNAGDFTIHSMLERVLHKGDLWWDILHRRQDLRAMIAGSTS